MKLNNRGWGYNSLVIFGTIFLVILLFVAIAIKTFIKNEPKSNESNTTSATGVYSSYEGTVKKAGETYKIYHETLVNNSDNVIIVNEDTLYNEGLLEKLYDPSGDGYCSSFALINLDGTVKGFISCSEYETSNYDLWVE